MGQENSVPQVSDGVPWWLWLVVLLATTAVVLGIVAGQKKEETAPEIFARAVVALDAKDGAAAATCLEALKHVAGANDQIAVLEGIKAGARNRDPRCVKLLEPFLDDANEQYRKLALKYSAISYQRMGNAVQAIELSKKCVEIDPSDVVLQMNLLRMYRAVGTIRLAEATAARMLKLEPDNRFAIEALGSIQMATGELVEAKRLFGSLLETEGDRATAGPSIIRAYVKILIDLGEADTALKFTRDNESLLTDEVATQVHLYMETNQLNDLEAAVKTLQLEDQSPLHLQVRGARAINEGNWELAIRLLGQVALQSTRSTQVFKQLELCATENEQNELAKACRANIDAIGRLEQQMQAAVSAIGDDLEDPDLRLAVAELAIGLGQFSVAEQWIDCAAMVSPGRQIEIRQRKNLLRLLEKPLVPIAAAINATTKSEPDVLQEESGTGSGGQKPTSDDVEPTATSSEETENSGSLEPTSEESATETTGANNELATPQNPGSVPE